MAGNHQPPAHLPDAVRRLPRRPGVLRIAAALLLLRNAAADPSPDAPRAPDILLVVVDSLRADHVGCYGQALATSPAIDALAASGARFARAFASGPWTQPSVMSLFTSVEPGRHGRVLPGQPHATNTVTLAETLRAAGYQTVGITANPMTNRRFGFARGFDHYDDYTVAMAPGADLAATAAKTAHDAVVTRLAEEWLVRRDPRKPLFLFLLYMDPHWDYLPPPPYDRLFTDDPVPPPRNVHSLGRKPVSPAVRARLLAAYAGEIRYTDDCLGRLFSALAASPRGASTAVALCGDHGESFWDRGVGGHGNNLHDEELHVPLVVRPPANASPASPGTVVEGQVGLVNVAPTLLDFAGVAPPPSWSGVTLRTLIAGGAAPERPVVLDTRIIGIHLRGVRTSGWKLVARPPFAAPAEAYDLGADPGETRNLVAADAVLPPAAAALVPLLLLPDPQGPTP